MSPHWWLAILLGVLAALLIIGLSLLGPKEAAEHGSHATGLAWRGLLASFYGGIVEEVECRLLLVSALVWLLARCNRRVARPWMFDVAIVWPRCCSVQAICRRHSRSAWRTRRC